MPQLSKVRIVNFQYNDGKRMIADELFNFSNSDQNAALNVLINLANGGGKSVLVQLMLQPIIPKAKVAGRKIESFFTKASDHCFILLEWIKDNGLGSEKLLTGIAMAASEGTSTNEEADTGRGMGIKYYTYCSEYNGYLTQYDIVNMPLSRKENGRFVVADFDYVRSLSRNSRGVLNYFSSDSNPDWSKKLEEYGIVQNEWHMIERLNSEEGGLGKYFEGFKSSAQLIDKLFIPTIEGKLSQGRRNGEDESLITMMLSYVKQYQAKQSVINDKEMYESFRSELSQIRPVAEKLWNCDDQLQQCIRKLFGFSASLSVRIEELKSEQITDKQKLAQSEEKAHHVEWERASAEYYEVKAEYDKAFEAWNVACREAKSLKQQSDAARVQVLILECVRYYHKLCEIKEKIEALKSEIAHREDGTNGDDEIASLKYSVYAGVTTELPIVQQQLKEKKSALDNESEHFRQITDDCVRAENEMNRRRDDYTRQSERVNIAREQTDKAVSSLGGELNRRLDGYYADEELQILYRGKKKEDAVAKKKDDALCETLKKIEEGLKKIPQQRADISIKEEHLGNQINALNKDIEQYKTRESKIQNICNAYNLDFDSRFSDRIHEYLKELKNKNAAQIADILRRISIADEAVKAVERGTLHVLAAVIEYLNSTGIHYSTCEKYLFELVSQEKIDKETCLSVLRNYPAVAYGIYITKDQIEQFFRCDRIDWLPAMIPLFTPEQMEQILHSERKFSGSIAFYAETYFSDKDHYLINLREHHGKLTDDWKLLESQKEIIETQLTDVQNFSYSKTWFNEQTAFLRKLSDELDKCGKEQESLKRDEEELNAQKAKIKQDIANNDSALSELTQFFENFKDITNLIQIEIDNENQAAQKRILHEESISKCSALKSECDRIRQIREDLDSEVKELKQREIELNTVKTEVDGCPQTGIIPGLWTELIIRYRERVKTQDEEMRHLKGALHDCIKETNECQAEISRRSIPEDQYIHIVYHEEEETKAREKECRLQEQYSKANEREKDTLSKKSHAEGEMQSVEKAVKTFGSVLDKSQIGSDFTNRLRSIKSEQNSIRQHCEDCFKQENQLNNIFERVADALLGYQEFAEPITVSLESQVSQIQTQYDELRKKKDDCFKNLNQAKEQTKESLRQMKTDFATVGIGISEAVSNMISLFESTSRGDRYYTLVEHIANSMDSAERAISKIITDLKEFENSHLDLIRQCTLQGQQIYEGLRQMSKSSSVTVYNGKKPKQMLVFDMPSEIDVNIAQTAIAGEIDIGTKELVEKIENGMSEIEIRKATEVIVGSKTLFRKYIGKDSVQVQAYKIDQNPENGGCRTWENTQINNSGAEKFVVYFSVILALMNFTRSDIGELHDRDLHSVLILDNPFGATSSKHILEPMFAIAKHFNVQMICLSDINKSDVINCFNIVIKAIVKQRSMSNRELLTHEGNEQIEHGFYRSEQMSLL